MPKKNTLPKFNSFMMAGFECTYAKAEEGKRFDLLAASKHDELCREDYRLLKKRGIFTVREGLSWNAVDRGDGVYDFSRYEPMMKIAREEGIQQVWDLSHFDYPERLNPFSGEFAKAYGEYAERAIEVIRKYQKGTLYICPMNEASFFAWMCDRGLWAPYQKGKGTGFKMQLVKASLAAMKAIRAIDKNVKFIHVDPYMYRRPLHARSQLEREFCDNFNNVVKYHSWDMISGRANPELGGHPDFLDIVGVNYYFYNQQQVGIDPKDHDSYTFKSISLSDKKRLRLHQVLTEIYDRYKKPMVLMETGSYRDRRPAWWKYILSEVETALKKGLPLFGVCAYPTLDIYSGAGFIIPKSGLFDFDQRVKDYKRIPHEETWKVIKPYVRKLQKLSTTSLFPR